MADFDPERFALFFSQASIPAKEGTSEGVVGRVELFPPQIYTLKEIAAGLASGEHIFWILKARQQGVTTEILLLLAYWSMTHPGMIFSHIAPDTELKEVNRALLAGMLHGIPAEWRLGSPLNNRTMLEFDNGSRIIWLNANSKKGKSSGLGQGIGMLGLHGTEIGSWTDDKGLRSLMASLAQKNPNRLYIFEGTSKGAGLFKDYWTDAAREGVTGRSAARALFVSWWLNPFYAFDLSDKKDLRLHERYLGSGRLGRQEEGRVQEVEKRYGYKMRPEQLSWWRWMSAEQFRGREEHLFQEYPWLPEDAWIYGAKGYVSPAAVSIAVNRVKNRAQKIESRPQAFTYKIGPDFQQSGFEPATFEKGAYDLVIYEQPASANIDKRIERIVISCDPTHGANELSDLGVIHVWRAHTDRLVQLAEYARTDAPAYHLAWVLLELAALYDAQTKVIIELQGGGQAMHDELNKLQSQITTGYNESLARYFEKLDFYRFYRPDGTTRRGASSYHWITTAKYKRQMLHRLQGEFERDKVDIRSIQLLKEIQDTTQGEDGEITPAQDDNRLMAAAIGVMGWDQVIQDDIRDEERFSYGRWLEAIAKKDDGEEVDPSEAYLKQRVSNWKDLVRKQIVAANRRAKDVAMGNVDEYTDNWDAQDAEWGDDGERYEYD